MMIPQESSKPVRRLKSTLPVMGFLLGAILVVTAVWFLLSSQRASKKAVLDVSNFYLSELTVQTIGHFQTSLEGQTAQLQMVVSTVTEEDLKDLPALQSFIRKAVAVNQFDFFAYVDSGGMVYTADSVFPGISKIDSLVEILDSRNPVISVNQTLADQNMVLITLPVHKAFGDTELAVGMVGLSMETITRQLSLQREEAQTYSSVLQKSGDYIIHTQVGNIQMSSNLFSFLRDNASFSTGYSLKTLQEDFINDRSGLASITVENAQYYIFYAPIPDTDWIMLTTIPYTLINTNIQALSKTLTMDSLVMLGAVVLVLLSVFLTYIVFSRRNQRYLQEAYRQADAANRAKSEFLSRMSHEIRTPMNGIIGMTEIALRSSGQPKKMTDCLQKIAQASKLLLSLLNDVLDMARIESGKIELQHVDFSLAETISGLTGQFGQQAEEKELQFEVVLIHALDERFNGDPLRLSQILNNLLSNAIKFTPTGGNIHLELEPMKREEDRLWVRFIVADTGCGIAYENQAKIFDAFEQEKAETAQNYGGTGLGLPIVKRFSEMMGGSVHLESEAGQGARFWVELPLNVVEGQRPPQEDFSPWRAAIAISDTRTRQYLAELLRELHIEICESKDVVSCDVCIMDKNAMERSDPPAGVPLLLLAVDTAGSLEFAENHGAAGLLAMPAFRSTLVRALRGLREQDCAISAVQTASTSFAGKTILIAEDNELNLEIAMSLLAATGAEMMSAKDGQEALERFQNSPVGQIDLILMDIQMPRMDGLKATRQIRASERPDASTVPILAMSANAFAEDVERSLQSGMNGHLSKPIDVDEVYARINEFFSHSDTNEKE